MTPRSLRLRMALIAAAALAPALAGTWLAQVVIFERHLERRYLEQLDIHAQSVTSRIVLRERPELDRSRPLSDPRFDRPLSGVYWRLVDERSGEELRSRSLWDRPFNDPAEHPGALWRGQTRASDGHRYLLVQRRLQLGPPGAPRPVAVQIAMDRQPLAAAQAEFARELALGLALLGAALGGVAWFQAELGLRPLHRLRAATEALERDPAARLSADVPDEVQPMVRAINTLLESRAAMITAAYRRADDLAHALKTPLSALRNQAAKLAGAGDPDLAASLKAATQAMEARLGSELSRARAAVSVQAGPSATLASPLVDRLISVASRTPAGERLSWSNQLPPDLALPLAESDLADVLGPLLENAAAWSASRIAVVADADAGAVAVEDDGPGMAPAARRVAPQRGVRLDQRGEGTGLGLAIAAEILGEYGWALDLGRSPLGGLRAAIGPRPRPEPAG